MKYWKECIAEALEESGIKATYEQALAEIQELITMNWRVPRMAKFSGPTKPLEKDGLQPQPPPILLKDCLLPIIKDMEITKKREAYLIEVVHHLVSPGCLFHYHDNIKKQKFLNELADAIPDHYWPVAYPPNAKQKRHS